MRHLVTFIALPAVAIVFGGVYLALRPPQALSAASSAPQVAQSQPEPPATVPGIAATEPSATRPAVVVITLRATYGREMGPHINMPNGARAYPMIDKFTVTGASDPRLVGVVLSVRFGSPKSAAYPKNLESSQEVHLRMTPSAETQRQIEDNLARGHKFASVNGDELEADETKQETLTPDRPPPIRKDQMSNH